MNWAGSMSGQQIFANVDEDVATLVNEIAEQEQCQPAQIAGDAVRLYTLLSSEAQNAIRAVENAGSPEDKHWLTNEVTRVLLRAEMVIAQRRNR
jgi:hypothetical protein